MKRIFFLILLLWVPALQAKPLVVAVQYPLAFLAQTLAGDDFMVKNLTPPGVDPHEYQPGLRSMAQASRANLFLFNSPYSEPWAERFSQEVRRQGGTVFIAQSAFDPQIGTHGRDDLPANYFDPHWWLDPLLTLRYADKLSQIMIQVSPKSKAAIKGRLRQLEKRLIALDLTYVQALSPCKQRKILVAHNAYQYMGLRYHLEIFALQGITAESKPGLRTLTQAIKWVKKYHLKTIFFESLTNPKLSQSLAKEAGVKTLKLSPLGNISKKDIQKNRGYFELMKENLTHLTQGLGCQMSR